MFIPAEPSLRVECKYSINNCGGKHFAVLISVFIVKLQKSENKTKNNNNKKKKEWQMGKENKKLNLVQ